MQTHFDWPYAVLYLILIFEAFQYYKSRQKSNLTISIAVAFVFVAFRAPVVGADTWNYVRYLTGERYFYNDDPRELEFLFIWYRTIVNDITDSRLVVMLINTIVSFTPVLYLIKKYSLNASLSLLLFFYLGCTNLYFVGLRQILGFSFILWALLYIQYTSDNKEKKMKILYTMGILLFAITIAYNFHTSNIIYGVIIICAIFIPLKSKFVALMIIGGSAVIGLVLSLFDVLSFFNYLYLADLESTERLSGYLLNEDMKDVVPLFLLFRLTFLSSFTIICIDEKKVNHLFTKLFVFGVVVFNLLYSVPMIDRFLPIFLLFGCVVFTWIFGENYIKHKEMRFRTNLICVLIVLYLTRSAFIGLNIWDPKSEDRMHPYYFFFQDYKDHPSIKKFR